MHACLDDVVVQSGQGYIRDKLADQDSSLCREFFSICLQHLVMALKLETGLALLIVQWRELLRQDAVGEAY
jgi:hypothetical protein